MMFRTNSTTEPTMSFSIIVTFPEQTDNPNHGQRHNPDVNSFQERIMSFQHFNHKRQGLVVHNVPLLSFQTMTPKNPASTT